MRLTRRTVLARLSLGLGALTAGVGGGLGAMPAARAADGPASMVATDSRLAQKWLCRGDQCRPYIYDPMLGDPDSGIPPETAFEDIPEDWICPICGYGKEVFVKLTPSLERAIRFRW